jgi:hypothetical protein
MAISMSIACWCKQKAVLTTLAVGGKGIEEHRSGVVEISRAMRAADPTKLQGTTCE